MSPMTWSMAVVAAADDVGAAGTAGAGADDGDVVGVAAGSVLDAGADVESSNTVLRLVLAFWDADAVVAASLAPPPPQALKTREISNAEGIAMRVKSLLLERRIGDYLH
ncbi:hypothetical protein D3878_05310 [Noviherbaspirillum sedimenti]|uniref:Uncharacterized protein n=1 Tax=Noviherbaspirillum sedimenti TaxID=2320865 RepID=A0A3A3FY04_9BURK|nr:hypothetical protein D3878_05310 [Noviherbaspirillum sedimenti]